MTEAGEGSARGYALDLADDGSVAALIAAIEGDLGGLDIVVCNGGGPPPGPIAEVTPELWGTQFHKMFVNQTRIVTAFLPGMRQRGHGRVLVLASSGVVQPIESLGISNALRGAQIGWAKTLSNEVAGDGVTVNTVVPGRIHTARVDQIDQAAADRRGTSVEDVVHASHAAIPMGRYGRVEECADVPVFLLGDRASYVTGSVIRVDGGMIRSV
jgi:3-oxoacyl-[acyl-carrier protein] reductase